MRHKHADLIIAWAEGAEIQYWSARADGWVTAIDPNWSEDIGFRIKPVPKPDVVLMVGVELLEEGDIVYASIKSNLPLSISAFIDHIKLTFDGEAKNLKSAEVIK